MRPSGIPLLIEALALEVKKRREELKITQEDLAGRSELGRPYITAIEIGRKQPTLSVLYRIAQGLDLAPSALMRRVERRFQTLLKVEQSGKSRQA
jgi:transcriptional regulator with XRE-family HTH domain